MIISGKKRTLDVDDLRKHTRYQGCSSWDKNVKRLWKVLAEMTPENKMRFLKFCTSCSRPPIMGFQELTPPFTLQLLPIAHDSERLPTAQTCFNMLRLPTYSSHEVLKTKLEYAINSDSGFELT